VRKRFVWPVLLIVVFALSRWPNLMPQNFSAAYAIAFCGGFFLSSPLSWAAFLCAMAAIDVLITIFFYTHGGFLLREFMAGMWPNYVAYLGIIALGRAFGGKRPWWMLVGGGILGALLFYIVTNTGAWLSLPYNKSLAGWIQALTRGLPGYPPTWEFFRNTLLSGGIFTGLFVGAMKLTEESEAESKEEEEKESEESPGEPGAEPAKAES
jgi:hypothetical protein